MDYYSYHCCVLLPEDVDLQPTELGRTASRRVRYTGMLKSTVLG